MSALTVLILRHAEKPFKAWPGEGTTFEGATDDKSLVLRGWQRAGAWAALFGGSLGGDAYPAPQAIYALNPTKPSTGGNAPSSRPLETITPLVDRLHLKPNTDWGLDDEQHLADEIVKLTGVVLVCWEHKHIAPALLTAFLGSQRVPGLPAAWRGSRFDVVLRLDRAVPGAAWSFKQQFPRLLSGDSDLPVDNA
jgi:hypothetical protein